MSCLTEFFFQNRKLKECLFIPNSMIGKIYILLFPSGKWYIGSTSKRWLSSRISSHKIDCERGVNSHLYNHAREIGWENMIAEVIEEFEVPDRHLILAREQEYLNEYFDENCLNQVSAYTGLTKAEYMKQMNNKPEWKEYAQTYRETHREKHKAYMKAYREKRLLL